MSLYASCYGEIGEVVGPLPQIILSTVDATAMQMNHWRCFESPRVSRRLQTLRGWSHEESRSRGAQTTNLHVALDGLGNPLRVILSAGQIPDIEQAAALIHDQPAEILVANKGYDSDVFVQTTTA